MMEKLLHLVSLWMVTMMTLMMMMMMATPKLAEAELRVAKPAAGEQRLKDPKIYDRKEKNKTIQFFWLSKKQQEECVHCILNQGDIYVTYPEGDVAKVGSGCLEWHQLKDEKITNRHFIYHWFTLVHHCREAWRPRVYFIHDFKFVEPYGPDKNEEIHHLRPIVEDLNDSEAWKALGMKLGANVETTTEKEREKEEQPKLRKHEGKRTTQNGEDGDVLPIFMCIDIIELFF